MYSAVVCTAVIGEEKCDALRLRNGGFMLREWKEPVRPGEEELKMRLAAAREKLAAQQLLIKEQKVPGTGAAGRLGNGGKRLLHRSDHREY